MQIDKHRHHIDFLVMQTKPLCILKHEHFVNILSGSFSVTYQESPNRWVTSDALHLNMFTEIGVFWLIYALHWITKKKTFMEKRRWKSVLNGYLVKSIFYSTASVKSRVEPRPSPKDKKQIQTKQQQQQQQNVVINKDDNNMKKHLQSLSESLCRCASRSLDSPSPMSCATLNFSCRLSRLPGPANTFSISASNCTSPRPPLPSVWWSENH